MPSSMTHTYFGIDVYHGLSFDCKKKLDNKLEHFKIFAQGSDPFMFYHFFLGKKAQNSKMIQTRMHKEKTQEFFLSIIQLIHQKKLINNPEVMAYLYGYICHYYLDYYTHPFIYYKTGVFQKDNKSTYQYNGVHQEMEYLIDSYFIAKKEGINPEKFKIHENIFSLVPFSNELKIVIEESIGQNYSIPEVSSHYQKCLKYMKAFFYLANYDPYGIKLRVYKIIDKITPKNITKVQELSYYNDYRKKIHYLNLDHRAWCYPWNKEEKFYTSFLDLYDKARNHAIETIIKITKLLENKTLNLNEIKKIFPNLSYVTGKYCDENLIFLYFDF